MATKRNGDSYDRFLSRLVRTLASLLGLILVVYEARWGREIEFALLGVGIAGLPFGNTMERFMLWLVSLRPPPPAPPTRREDER